MQPIQFPKHLLSVKIAPDAGYFDRWTVPALLQDLIRVVFIHKVHDVLMPLLLGRHANQRTFRLPSDGL
jgi:hypothetical protein